jgi:sulfate transport system substrate-binding protein
VASRHAADFRKIKTVTVDERFGGWRNTQKVHFAEGGIFDSLYSP